MDPCLSFPLSASAERGTLKDFLRSQGVRTNRERGDCYRAPSP